MNSHFQEIIEKVVSIQMTIYVRIKLMTSNICADDFLYPC